MDIPSLPPGLVTGQTILYTIQRGETTLELPVTLVRGRSAGYLYNMAWRFWDDPQEHVVAAACFLVVIVAFWLRPRNLGARYLFLIFGFYFAVTVFGFGVPALFEFTYHPWQTFWHQLEPTSWIWYFFPSLTLMALAFPVIKAPLHRFPRLLPSLLYGLPGITSLIMAALTVITRSHQHEALAIPVLLITITTTVLTLFGTILHNWLTIREPVARAQLSWLTLGLGLGLAVPFATLLVVILLKGRVDGELNNITWMIILLPLSLTVAITRYRLFDINIIIRRTLQYSILTGLLGLVYFGGVVLFQGLFRTASGEASSLAVVLSTLIIAALFTPLRRRIQTLIDRRFFRQKYDAAHTLADFARTARDETDINQLTVRLVEVVQETLQPEHVSLWLRPDPTDFRNVSPQGRSPRNEP
jgi:hypothetical protein